MAKGGALIEPKPPDSSSNILNDFKIPKGKWSKIYLFMALAKNNENKKFSDFSPFKVFRFIQSFCPKINIKFLKSGALLIEATNEKECINLKSIKTFENYQVQLSLHNSLNFSQGIITCDEFLTCTEEELTSELSSQGVVSVKRIYKTVNSNKIPTPSLILRFQRPEIPQKIVLEFLSIKVRPYYKPLLCYNCYDFRHGAKSCPTKIKICGRCSECHTGYCEKDPKCKHCSGPHPVWSNACPVYKKEKQIEELRVSNKISYAQAERLLRIPNPTQATASCSYSDATVALPTTHAILEKFEKLTNVVETLFNKINAIEASISNKPIEICESSEIPQLKRSYINNINKNNDKDNMEVDANLSKAEKRERPLSQNSQASPPTKIRETAKPPRLRKK